MARRGWRMAGPRLAGYLLLTIGAVVMIGPALWMISASFMTLHDVRASPVNVLPPSWHPENYVDLFTRFRVGRYLTNSLIVTGAVVLLNIVFSTMAGYSLAKYDFPGRNLIFGFILSTIMVPFAVILIPLYLIVRTFGWVNTYQGLIMPFALSAFGIFLMRQYMLSVPNEYLDAARIDGASEFGIFWRIVMPLARPAVITLAIVTFVGNWDEFLWPLIVATEDRYRTLPVGLAAFLQDYQNEWHLLMAGAVVAAAPVVLLFVLMQGRFLESMAGLSGLRD